MAPPHSFLSMALALVILVVFGHQVSALAIEYCSDINTSTGTEYSSIYQSNGLCYNFCEQSYAFAIVQSEGCWCSNYAPATSTTGCTTTCPGYPDDLCGGDNLYGYIALPNSPSGTEGASSTVSSTTVAAQVTVTSNASPVTVYETIVPTPSSTAESESTSEISTTSAASKTSAESTTTTPTSTTPTSTIIAITTSSSDSSSSTWTPTPITSLETITGSLRTVTITPTVPPNAQSTASVTKSSKSSGGLGTGGAVGLAIGLVALIAIIASIIYFCIRKRHESQSEDLASNRGSSAGLGRTPSRTMSQNSRFVLNTDGHRVVENWENGDVVGSRRSRLMPVDPRLDPFSPVYQRDSKSRESFNTIRDDHDYSRRVHQQAPVLRAMNPDETAE